MIQPHIADRWAALNFKAGLGDGTERPPDIPTWVDALNARRLMAYRILHAYASNSARYFRPGLWDTKTSIDARGRITFAPPAAEKYREYGDGALLVLQARAALLGEEQSLSIPAAADLAEDASAEEQAEHDRAVVVADWLDRWATAERLWLKLSIGEGKAVELGDSVYVLGWSVSKARPRLRVYDPGDYFPVFDDDDDEFPAKVHIAYEIADTDGNPEFLRRLTWQLGPIVPATDADGYAVLNPVGTPLPSPGDFYDHGTGLLSRRYPWQADSDAPSTTTCYFTDATWSLKDLKGGRLADLSDSAATYRANRRDLRIDFVPVVHVPNTATDDDWGESVITLVGQVLDDLASTDTDLQESGALVGSATLVTKGAGGLTPEAGPGARLELPDSGSASYLDTSRNLDALLGLSNHLLDRLSVNARIAAALLGRVKPNEVPSGVALALGFSPTQSLVREMRQVRDEKLPLIPKFAARIAMAGQVLEAGPVPRVAIVLGPYLPADKAQAVEEVGKLLPIGAMSTLTAVQTLVAAGFPIDDAEAEVERIEHESFAKAAQLLDALGDETAVAEYLGRAAPVPPAPTVVLPPPA